MARVTGTTHGNGADLLDSLADAMHDPLLVFDAGRRVLYANDAAFRFAARLHAVAPPSLDTIDAWHPDLVSPAALAVAATEREWIGEVSLPAVDTVHPVVLLVHVAALRSTDGARYGVVVRDASADYARRDELNRRNIELKEAYRKLKGAQEQLIQSEKLASIGQLAAGVAHEINNPIGYVHSNLGTLADYSRHLLTLIGAYDDALRAPSAAATDEIAELRRRFDIDFVVGDLPALLSESREGIERVRKIVQDLKDFSRSDRGDGWVHADLHRGLDSTLNIVWNEIKYKGQIVKSFGELPAVECLPSELNQVFMNILMNAAQAIGEQGIITISTGTDGSHVWVAIGDDGEGIPEANLSRIFDPFFTTKPVGKGTGLGLAISYGIVTKHNGRIDVTSTPGQGSMFRIVLPVKQPVNPAAE
ncbi:MAG TPA: ATP-binding protein [Tahibacter sp.]|nr:ATP-binding protein [Tahibacter sp.]